MTNRINTTADLMTAAAAALIRRDGDAFNRLIQTNESWLQPEHETEATRRALTAMQEAAYFLDGEPSEYSPDFGEADDQEEEEEA